MTQHKETLALEAAQRYYHNEIGVETKIDPNNREATTPTPFLIGTALYEVYTDQVALMQPHMDEVLNGNYKGDLYLPFVDGSALQLWKGESPARPGIVRCSVIEDGVVITPYGEARYADGAWTATVRLVTTGNEVAIVDWDIDEASYEGDGDDGVYYQAAEGPGGWYLTVVVDSNTGCFTHDMSTDDGPYKSEEEALTAGRGAARDWCFDNEVNPDEDDDEGEVE